MAEVGRSRRHSLSNPLVLCGLPPAPVPFVDARSPPLLRGRTGSMPRKELTSPVDSLLDPDLRFPQGGAGVCRLAEDDGQHSGRRQRSKSVGAQASLDASPSLRDVRGVLSLVRQRGLGWPLALAPALVAAYCEFHDELKRLRRGYLTRNPWVKSPDIGRELRSLVRAAGPAETDLLPIVFPARRSGARTSTGAQSATDLLTPAVAHQLANRVEDAATTLTRAQRRLDRWRARFDAITDWQGKIKTGADDARYLAKSLERGTMVKELEREKDRLHEELLERIIPNATQDLHANVQNVLEFMRQKGLYHKKAECAMSVAWPAPVPGGEAEKGRRPQDPGGQPQQREVTQQGEETAYASVGPSAAARQAGGNETTSPHSWTTVRGQRLHWAYLRLRYNSPRRWRRINHAVAVEVFLAFQHDLEVSMAAAAARGKKPGPTTVLLYDKAEASVHWHAEQLERLAPSPSPPGDDQNEKDRSEHDEPAFSDAPSLVDVAIGNSDDGEAWASRVCKSLRQVGSSSGSTSRRSGEEMEESQGEGPSGNSFSSDAAPARALGGSNRDSGVAVWTVPSPSASCMELMQQAGTATQRRRQKGKRVARG